MDLKRWKMASGWSSGNGRGREPRRSLKRCTAWRRCTRKLLSGPTDAVDENEILGTRFTEAYAMK